MTSRAIPIAIAMMLPIKPIIQNAKAPMFKPRAIRPLVWAEESSPLASASRAYKKEATKTKSNQLLTKSNGHLQIVLLKITYHSSKDNGRNSTNKKHPSSTYDTKYCQHNRQCQEVITWWTIGSAHHRWLLSNDNYIRRCL